VNTASRMASLGDCDRIQVTEDVVHLLAGRYTFRPRGPLEVKGKGTMETWFLEALETVAAPEPTAAPPYLPVPEPVGRALEPA
jgi:class 3 adenylate cyclase